MTGVAFTVTGRERQELLRLAGLLDVDPQDQEAYCALAHALADDLPTRLSGRIDEFDHQPDEPVLILSGLPTGEVPPTPCGNSSHVGKTTRLARVQAIINHRLGSMVAYETQASGQLFHDLGPSLEESGLQTSLSYEVELDGHTEQCFSPLRPDFLSLACLRSGRGARTYVFSTTDLLEHVPAGQRDTLFRPLWETGIDTSFRMPSRGRPPTVRGPISLLSGDGGDPFLTIDETLTRGLSVESQALLELVLDLYHVHRREIALVPGDLLILDNNRCMHGRSSFAARLDGTDRFLLRTFLIRFGRTVDSAMRANSRTILAKYS